MKLYGSPPTRVLRAMWLLNELGLDYENVPLDLLAGDGQKPEYLSINPAGKSPALVDGDLKLTESAAIQLYLAEKHPQAGFIPEGLAARADMYRWLFFLMTEIEAPLWRMALHEFLYDEKDRDPAEIRRAARDCARMLAVLEKHMEGRKHLVGDRLSVADFNAAYTLDWADVVGLLDDKPNLKAFVERMYARPKAPPRIAAAQKG